MIMALILEAAVPAWRTRLAYGVERDLDVMTSDDGTLTFVMDGAHSVACCDRARRPVEVNRHRTGIRCAVAWSLV